ncbi:MAG: zinc ribbon domain-containing protein [Pseudomonadota bacterium]
MPIYEYKCDLCGEEFEELVLCSSPEVNCPKCKKPKVTKLMSSCSFKSGGNFSSSAGDSGCGTCSSNNCSSCH